MEKKKPSLRLRCFIDRTAEQSKCFFGTTDSEHFEFLPVFLVIIHEERLDFLQKSLIKLR